MNYFHRHKKYFEKIQQTSAAEEQGDVCHIVYVIMGLKCDIIDVLSQLQVNCNNMIWYMQPVIRNGVKLL